MISKNLRAYLQSWQDWVDRGALEGRPYSRLDGLCLNLWDCPHIQYDAKPAALNELRLLFGNQGHPFGDLNYFEREYDATQHEDPARLAWVAKMLAESAE